MLHYRMSGCGTSECLLRKYEIAQLDEVNTFYYQVVFEVYVMWCSIMRYINNLCLKAA